VSGLHVDLGALDGIAAGLDKGADGLDDLAGGVPTGIDAGPMTAVVDGMLSQIVNSAGNVSSALTGAAELVRVSRRYYERTDAEEAAGLTRIQEVMRP